MRGDTLNPPLLGMSGTVSEDVVRRAMKRMDERAGLAWLSGELRACIEPVLRVPWVLDIDCTVKPLYGHQQGAQIGYNPHSRAQRDSPPIFSPKESGQPRAPQPLLPQLLHGRRAAVPGRRGVRRKRTRRAARAARPVVAARRAAAHALARVHPRGLRVWK